MVVKRCRSPSNDVALEGSRGVDVGAFPCRGDTGRLVDSIGKVGGDAVVDRRLVHAVAEHVVDRAMRPIDRELCEIGSPEAGQLGIEIREEPCLHERVVGGLNPRHQVAGVKGDLFGLREIVRRDFD